MIQTRKIKNFPVVLFGADYWRGMLEWIKDTMLSAGNIDEVDTKLLYLTDSPQEAVDIVVRSQDSLRKYAHTVLSDI